MVKVRNFVVLALLVSGQISLGANFSTPLDTRNNRVGIEANDSCTYNVSILGTTASSSVTCEYHRPFFNVTSKTVVPTRASTLKGSPNYVGKFPSSTVAPDGTIVNTLTLVMAQ